MTNTKQLPGSRREFPITVNDTTILFLGDSKTSMVEITEEREQLVLQNLHTHAFGELFCGVEGCTRINIDHTITALHPGDFLYVPAHLPHVCLTEKKDAAFRAIGVKLLNHKTRQETSELHSFLEPLLGSRHPLILKNQPAFTRAWTSILHTYDGKHNLLFSLQLLSLLTQMIQAGFEALPGNPGLEEYLSDRDINRIASLEYIIDSQFMTSIDRKKIAEQLFISTRQLDRICKKRYDMTFRERVIHCRIISAAQMLLDTDQTAEVIAHTVGFASKTSFYKEFQKKYGITPLQYRHRYKS